MQNLTLHLHTPALTSLIKFFNETGTAHLIAPSGFKVTILAGLVAGSTRWLYKRQRRVKQEKPLLPAQRRAGQWRRWLATALVILSISGYTFLSGGGPAATRAGIMGILLVVAPRLGRIYNIYTALALAALLMSLFDPFVLWGAGFQLSMLGTLGIVVLTPLFLRLFHPIERLPFVHPVMETVAVTLAAQVATLPIIAFTFQQVSFIAPLTNLLTVPLLGAILVLGTVVCGAGAISIQLGMLCGLITWPLLWYVDKVVSWGAILPGAFATVNNLDARLAWCYYALLILVLSAALHRWPVQRQPHEVNAAPPLLSRPIRPVLRYAAVIIVILASGVSVAAAQPNQQLTITLLNVGPAGKPAQGEAILIHTADGRTAFIDGGADSASLSQELDSRLPFWQRSIDTVILTTPRQDHIVGLYIRYNQMVHAGVIRGHSFNRFRAQLLFNERWHKYESRAGSMLNLGTDMTAFAQMPLQEEG